MEFRITLHSKRKHVGYTQSEGTPSKRKYAGTQIEGISCTATASTVSLAQHTDCIVTHASMCVRVQPFVEIMANKDSWYCAAGAPVTAV